jgi:hypothetical protein
LRTKANRRLSLRSAMSVGIAASMSAGLGRAGIRQRSALAMARMASALLVAAVSMMASQIPSVLEAGQRPFYFGGIDDPNDARIGIAAPCFPFRYRALWIRLDECDAFPVLHRRDGKSDGQRALAASAFLRDQSKDVHFPRILG